MKRERTSLARNVETGEITKKPLQSTRVYIGKFKNGGKARAAADDGNIRETEEPFKTNQSAKSSLASQAPQTQLDIQAIKVKQVKRPKLLRLLDHAKDEPMSVQEKSSQKRRLSWILSR